VHAYCLMGTHYHLLLRSVDGRLAEAMHRVQTAYSRRFNRLRRRDGPLVRGRYHSKPVRSLRYRRVLVAYIDDNPRSAGLASDPRAYPYGSAVHYARKGGPPWLAREWIESEVIDGAESSSYEPTRYPRVFCRTVEPSMRRLVERRCTGQGIEDPLDDLVSSAPGRVLAWMRRKAKLADGTSPGMPLVPLEVLDQVLSRHLEGDWTIGDGSAARPGRAIAWVGLGRELCQASGKELTARIGLSHPVLCKLHRLHRDLISTDDDYARRVESAALEALECWRTA